MPTKSPKGLRSYSIQRKHLSEPLRRGGTYKRVSHATAAESDADYSNEGVVECRVATTANITLSGSQTIDGVTLSDDDIVLVKDQSTQTENGYYIYDSSGAWSRTSTTILAAQIVAVREGSTHADTLWLCANDSTPDVGTDNITYASVAGVNGSGTAPRVPQWSNSTTLTDSDIGMGSSMLTYPVGGAPSSGKVNFGASGTDHCLSVQYTGTTANKAAVYGVAGSGSSSTAGVRGLHNGAGYGAYFESSSGTGLFVVSGDRGAFIQSTSGSNETLEVHVKNGNSGDGVYIYEGGDITGNLVRMHQATAAGTGDTLKVQQDGQGRGVYVIRNNATTGQALVEIHDDHASSTKAALKITNDGSSDVGAVGINVTTSKGAAGVFQPGDRYGIYVYRNDASPATQLGLIWDDNASGSQDTLVVRTDTTGVAAFKVQQSGTQVFEILATGTGKGVANFANSGVRFESVGKSANYTITENDHIIFCDTSTAVGNFTLTLPATPNAGQEFIIIDRENNANTNNVILGRNGNNIDGAAGNLTLNTAGFRIHVWSDGTDWYTN